MLNQQRDRQDAQIGGEFAVRWVNLDAHKIDCASTALSRDRESFAHLAHIAADASVQTFIGGIVQDLGYPGGDLLHLGCPHAARGHGRRAQPDSAGHRRFCRVVRDHVLVGMDAGTVQDRLRLPSR